MKLILQNRVKFNEEDIKAIEGLGYSIAYYDNQEIDGDVFVGILKEPFLELDTIKGLKYVQATMAGFDHLDLEDIKNRGITYCNASGIGSAPIAEYVVLKMLDYYQRGQYYRDLENQGVWGDRKESGVLIEELTHKRVLVLGTGHIGQDIAKRLLAFDVEMFGVNSNGRDVEYFKSCYALSDVLNYLDDIDVVINALPLNEHTDKFYDERFFKAMKEGSIFINVGRGPSVVISDLVSALDNNLAHAYLDVLPEEPLAKNSPLWRHQQISITPHNSSSSTLVKARTNELIIKNLENYINDKPLVNKVI